MHLLYAHTCTCMNLSSLNKNCGEQLVIMYYVVTIFVADVILQCVTFAPLAPYSYSYCTTVTVMEEKNDNIKTYFIFFEKLPERAYVSTSVVSPDSSLRVPVSKTKTNKSIWCASLHSKSHSAAY